MFGSVGLTTVTGQAATTTSASSPATTVVKKAAVPAKGITKATLTVRYVNARTKRAIRAAKQFRGTVGQPYALKATQLKLAGYQYQRATPATGTYRKQGTTVTLYYQPNSAKVTVYEYLLADCDYGQSLIKKSVKKGFVGDVVTVKAANYPTERWFLKRGTAATRKLTLKPGTNPVKFYYSTAQTKSYRYQGIDFDVETAHEGLVTAVSVNDGTLLEVNYDLQKKRYDYDISHSAGKQWRQGQGRTKTTFKYRGRTYTVNWGTRQITVKWTVPQTQTGFEVTVLRQSGRVMTVTSRKRNAAGQLVTRQKNYQTGRQTVRTGAKPIRRQAVVTKLATTPKRQQATKKTLPRTSEAAGWGWSILGLSLLGSLVRFKLKPIN